MRKFLALLLLPLSIVPVALAVPYVADQHESFSARYLEREALAAPAVASVKYRPVAAYRDRVPVLVYHGINDDGSRYSQTRQDFADQMAALHADGFHTVSAADVARFARGERVPLPSRPVLITFDDGRVDSFRGADAVLERYGFRATMFAIAGVTTEASRTYLGPDELASMEDSGRWDIQVHAGEGHTRIDGNRPYYGALESGESLDEFTTRVGDDLDGARSRLARAVGDDGLGDLFAVPYSDYGQSPGGDAVVAMLSLQAMTQRFTGVFVQSSTVEPVTRGQSGLLSRFEPTRDINANDLLRTLRRGTADKEA